jgi:hypothetical protein
MTSSASGDFSRCPGVAPAPVDPPDSVAYLSNMSSIQPDWPRGLGFGPGTVAKLAEVAAGKIARATDPNATHGVPQYLNAGGRDDGGTIRRYAEMGFIAEHDDGPPTLDRARRPHPRRVRAARPGAPRLAVLGGEGQATGRVTQRLGERYTDRRRCSHGST